MSISVYPMANIKQYMFNFQVCLRLEGAGFTKSIVCMLSSQMLYMTLYEHTKSQSYVLVAYSSFHATTFSALAAEAIQKIRPQLYGHKTS